MDSKLRSFEDALIVRNVVARTLISMEHATPEAMRDYLHEHPDADPKNHKVKKPSGGGSSSHEAEAGKSKSRSTEIDKSYDTMKGLQKKVDSANPTAKRQFDNAYDKLYSGGESAVKSAQKLIKQHGSGGGEQAEAAVEILRHALKDWERNRVDHARAKDEFSHKKLQQAEQTHGYAQKLEEAIQNVSKALKGDYD